jgi:ABC-type polysaccharide/polyol phosphate export permease
VATLALLLLFYLTPVFYDPRAVPSVYRPIYDLNPLSQLIGAYRTIFLRGDWPDLAALLAFGAIAAALLVLGQALFRRASVRFIEEL